MQHFVRVSEFSKCHQFQTHISNFALKPKDSAMSKSSIYWDLFFWIPHAINRALLIFSDRNLTFTTAKIITFWICLPLSYLSRKPNTDNFCEPPEFYMTFFFWVHQFIQNSLPIWNSEHFLCPISFATFPRLPDMLCCHHHPRFIQ